MTKLILATRKSPLALAQAEMVAARLREVLGVSTELLKMVTTGDRQVEWSLEQKGGKGLFTSELEQALLRGEADVAVHSTKDLPGEMGAGLEMAGYLPREDARDVLILRAGVATPKSIATGSPRRRLQVGKMYPGVQFTEIRGNVDTRLRKIGSDGVADATILAAAGLNRLKIGNWPGVEFHALGFDSVVPAVGQAAIGVQCRAGEASKFAAAFDGATARAVGVERAFQAALHGGCQTAFAAHVSGETLYLFHEKTGSCKMALSPADFAKPSDLARRILADLGLTS